MKKTILLALAVAFGVSSNAQNCIRLISTNPSNPFNAELSSVQSGYAGKTNPWLNTFIIGENDGTSFFPVNLNPNISWGGINGRQTNLLMVNPFDNGFSSYEYLYAQPQANQRDFHWEDGWELYWLNTGYYPNGGRVDVHDANRIIVPPFGPANPTSPYIMIYNRYTGKLRMFANLYAPLGTYQNIHASLTLKDDRINNLYVSGLFRHLDNYDKALDQYTTISTVSTYNKAINNDNRWFSSDIQLGYDPCICQYRSLLDFEFNAMSIQSLTVNGRSISASLNLIDANGNPIYKDFLTNIPPVDGNKNINGSGSFLYKRFDGMLEEYRKELDNYNTQMQTYNNPFNQNLRKVLELAKTGVSTAGANFLAPTGPIGDYATRQLVKLKGKNAKKSDTTTAKGWAEEVNKATKGILAQGFDFLTAEAFGKEFFKAPQKPSMPTATFTEMRFTGNIQTNNPVQVSSLITPGSYKYTDALSAHNYPAYNQVPGLFALLRTPSLNLFEKRDTLTQFVIHEKGREINDQGYMKYVMYYVNKRNTEHTFKFNLGQPLKYKLNRALDFDDENTELSVSFEIELENEEFDMGLVGHDFDPGQLKFTNPDVYISNAFPPSGAKNYIVKASTVWYPIEDAGEILFDFSYTDEGIRRTTTKLNKNLVNMGEQGSGPYSFLQGTTIPYTNACHDDNQPYVYACGRESAMFKIKKITMKIAADMYFDQIGYNGLQNNTFQSFTYLIYDQEKNIDFIQSKGKYEPVEEKVNGYKSGILHLSNQTIGPNDPFIFNQIGNKLYIKYEEVVISGNINVAPGYEVIIQSKKEFSIAPNAKISPEIWIKQTSGFSLYGKVSEATDDEVSSFCQAANDNDYKANLLPQSISIPTDPDVNINPQDKPESIVQSVIYPNPSREKFYVQLNNTEESSFRFEVYEMTGRKVYTSSQTGSNNPLFEMDLPELAAGNYFLRIINANNEEVIDNHKLMIIK